MMQVSCERQAARGAALPLAIPRAAVTLACAVLLAACEGLPGTPPDALPDPESAAHEASGDPGAGPQAGTSTADDAAPEDRRVEAEASSLVIVGLSPEADRDALLAGLGDAEVEVIPQIDAVILSSAVTAGGPDPSANAELIDALQQQTGVRYAESAIIHHAEPRGLARPSTLRPSDPQLAEQWHLDRIRAPLAWDSGGAPGAVVAVVDSGVDCEHEDLRSVCMRGRDFVDDDDLPQDLSGHGTHVASTAAGATDNALGVAGVAWGARVMPLRALGVRRGSSVDIGQAILYAADNGADVINLSLGAYSRSQFMADAITYAVDRGAIVLASTGNDDTDDAHYPSGLPNVIAVGATTQRDERAGFSNYGKVDLTAPGVDILAAARGAYAYYQGTSMATPIVSGVAALLRSRTPGLSRDEVAQILARTAVDLGAAGHDRYYGAGRVDAAAAVAALLPAPSATPPSTATQPPTPTALPTATPPPTLTATPTLPSVMTATPDATVRPDPSFEAPTTAPTLPPGVAPNPGLPGRGGSSPYDTPTPSATPTRGDGGFERPTPRATATGGG